MLPWAKQWKGPLRNLQSPLITGCENPFYSEKVQGELALKASRPKGLPGQSPASDVAPLHDGRSAGACTGKGRGGQTSGKLLGVFETPPSRMDGVGTGWERPGPKQTQGRMSATDDATMGVATDGRRAPAVDGQTDYLQRALEVELVNHLRVQNAQLMEEDEDPDVEIWKWV